MTVRCIEFTVKGQEIDYTCTEPFPRGDTKLYLRAKFSVDDAWDGLRPHAVFARKGREFLPIYLPLDESMTCDFPPELLTAPDGGGAVYIHVGLVGVDAAGGRLTTGCAAVRITPSCYVEGQTPPPPRPDVYAEILAQLKDAAEIDPEEVEAGINAYLEKNRIDVPMMTETVAGIAKVGDNLTIDDAGRLSVDTADTVEGDNTRPITAAAVYATVGNIEILLGTI